MIANSNAETPPLNIGSRKEVSLKNYCRSNKGRISNIGKNCTACSLCRSCNGNPINGKLPTSKNVIAFDIFFSKSVFFYCFLCGKHAAGITSKRYKGIFSGFFL